MNQKLSDQHSKLTNQNILFDEIDGKINILNSTFSKKLSKEHLESNQRDQEKIRNIKNLSAQGFRPYSLTSLFFNLKICERQLMFV